MSSSPISQALKSHLPWIMPTVAMAVLMALAALQGACTSTPEQPALTPDGGTEASSPSEASPAAARVITLGGTVTEIAFALGAGDRVIAVDVSSTHPPEAASRPRTGYHRALAAEGVLALEPDLIIGTDEIGPPTTLRQLRAAGVPMVQVPSGATVDDAIRRIEQVGEALGLVEEAAHLAGEVRAGVEAVAVAQPDRPRALFIYARGTTQLMVAGQDTAADTLFALSGVPNAGEGFRGFRPLTAEAVVAAAPDAIVMTTGGIESLGGREAVFALPGLANTPAARTGALHEIDDLLALGFGPRLPEAIATLRGGLASGAEAP